VVDALTRQLAGAVGLGGRDRRLPSAAERARVNVTKAIRTAIRRIAEHDPALAEHLTRTVRTGTFCVYAADPATPPRWEL
jgi:non-specific serine/threonine protein kinase